LSSGFNVFGADPRLADFELRAVLGVGAFGKVYLAKHRASSAACAIKSLSKGQLLEARLHQHVLQERDAMRDVAESPHTVRLLGTFQDATKLYMCTEVVMGGELFNRLNRVGGTISERDAAFYAACVALGLEYMQRKHYVYRDLKPENLLVDERGYVKIADFGFAKRLMPGERAYTLCGTPEYMAPELFKQTGHDKGVDWWALGVLAYEMVLGSPPFYAPDGAGASQMRRVLSGKYAFPKGAHRTSPAFEDFVKKLLNPNSAKRLGCLRDGAADVKRHPWLAENADFRGIADGVAPAPWTPPLRARAGARGDGSDQDFDVSCFDEYDLNCEHPGAAYEHSKLATRKGRAGKEDVFAGF
jgi:serine/threonine protein kinase